MKKKKYPYELKKQVVELYFEGESAVDLREKFNIRNRRRIYEWVATVREHGYTALEFGVPMNKSESELADNTLKEENTRLKLENEYLKRFGSEKGVNDKEAQYAFILEYSKDFPVTTLVEITDVSRSGYYKWLKRDGECAIDKRDEKLIPFILKIFNDHGGSYGRKRIKIALENEYGIIVNEKRISRIMRKYGL